MRKRLARYGLSVAVLAALLYWLPQFEPRLFALLSNEGVRLIALTLLVGVLGLYLTRLLRWLAAMLTTRRAQAAAYTLQVQQLRAGLASPKLNVRAIEDIANSGRRQGLTLLRSLQQSPALSNLEQDAAAAALQCVAARRPASGLYERLYQFNSDRWRRDAMADGHLDLGWMLIWKLKLWRYVNRRDHGQYLAVEDNLKKLLSNEMLDADAMKLFNTLQIKGGSFGSEVPANLDTTAPLAQQQRH